MRSDRDQAAYRRFRFGRDKLDERSVRLTTNNLVRVDGSSTEHLPGDLAVFHRLVVLENRAPDLGIQY